MRRMRRHDRPLPGPGGTRGGPPGSDDARAEHRRGRLVLVALLVASFVVITLDARRPQDSPVDRLRAAAAAVFGPLETAAAAAVRPVHRVTGYFDDVDDLRTATERLEAENGRLRSQLRTSVFAEQRVADLDRLLSLGRERDEQLVPAQVTALGAAQTFSRTVTIDVGREDGVRPDMTVLNHDGLVGRVIAASQSAATVLLVIDPDSVVGGRIGRSRELGFIQGEGDIGEQGRLTMELVDRGAEPAQGDTVLTWGSRNGAPYVAGVPVGAVTEVITSPRELSETVVVRPFVDFSSLDVVGVVVGEARPGDRASAAPPGGGR
jgi:rod shape-determining protein MreC